MIKKNKKRIIVVLGMHRSGTSAIARSLQAIGVDLGNNLMPPVPGNNEKGFYEDVEINKLNIELLKAFDSDWHALSFIPAAAFDQENIASFKLHAIELMRARMGDKPFGLKDPRIGRLLPFWHAVFDHLNVNLSYVIAVRHPMSVMHSLQRRDGFDNEKGYYLWLENVLMTILETTGANRVVVDYDLLMADPQAQLRRMAQLLDLSFNPDSPEVVEYINEFLDVKLRHTQFEFGELRFDSTAPADVINAYEMLIRLARDEINIDAPEVEGIFGQLNHSLKALSPALNYMTRFDRKVAERDGLIGSLNQTVAAREANVVHLHQAVAERDGLIANLSQTVESLIIDRDAQKAGLEQLQGAFEALARERDGQIDSLSQAVTERDGQIVSLRQVVTERDGQITGLSQAVSERDGQIGNLNQAVAERDDQIASLSQTVSERDGQIRNLVQAIAEIHGSTSWRVSSPVRSVGHQVLRIKIAMKALPYAFSMCGGYRELIKHVWRTYKHEGISGIKRRILFAASPGAPPPVIDYEQPAHSTDSVPNHNDYDEWVRRYDTLMDHDRDKIKIRINGFHKKPLISVVMPVYNPPLNMLEDAIRSVQGQLYPNWELCIADDASTDAGVHKLLQRYADSDARIKVVCRKKNGHISAASNSALELVNGEYVALLDNDDLLRETALFWVADAINANPDAGLIYSDEDKIDQSGRRYNPYFKSDWNPDLFLSHNMICHLGVYRTDLVRKLGGFREGYEGAQDYDLALRCTEQLTPQEIVHIPRVLYHWRSHPGSTAQAGSEKNYALPAGQRALNGHFSHINVSAKIELLDFGMYRARYAIPSPAPMVSLIIPTRNGLSLIKQCIESILAKTTYKNYEMLIVDNNSDDPDALAYFASIAEDDRIRVLRDERPFNYSALNNAAVKQAQGEYLGLVNNDIEVISPEWLEEMMGLAIQPGVGAVGARLWYPNDTLQHGGCITGVGGVAGHSHKHLPRGHFGYFARAQLIQAMSVVTAACLIVNKSIYQEVGGLDEANLKVAFNDVDFCLRVREAGYRNVWTPYAELYHHESATRGYEDTPEKQARFRDEVLYMKKRWGTQLMNDPAYSPNLTLEREDFSYAWPPRIDPI